MDHITFGNRRITYTIKRGNRKKTLAINVTSASQIIVLAPGHLSREKIRTFVEKKARWIMAKQEHFKRLAVLFPEREFVSGEQILLTGPKVPIKNSGGRKFESPEIVWEKDIRICRSKSGFKRKKGNN